MGRYYHGDIEGKFWFGIQHSDAGERFGCEAQEHSVINYYIHRDKLPEVKEEIASIEMVMGDWLPKLNKFFEENDSYNDDMLIAAGFPKDKLGHLLSEYADLCLGWKIAKCLEEQESCYFEAEL